MCIRDSGSTAQGTLHISVDDDSPAQPNDIAKSASEPQGIQTNLMVVLDLSGSMDNAPPGVSGFSTKLADVYKRQAGPRASTWRCLNMPSPICPATPSRWH